MQQDMEAYADAIDPQLRPLFDRLYGVACAAGPDAVQGISYGVPTWRLGKRRLYVGVWKHGLSVYGFLGHDGGFVERHPDLLASKGTIHLRPEDLAGIGDAELSDLFRAVLAA